MYGRTENFSSVTEGHSVFHEFGDNFNTNVYFSLPVLRNKLLCKKLLADRS